MARSDQNTYTICPLDNGPTEVADGSLSGQRQATPTPSHKIRRKILIAVLLAECLLTVLLLPSDFVISKRWAIFVHAGGSNNPPPPQTWSHALSDPPLGSAFPQLGNSERPVMGDPGECRGFLVVPVGNCSSCLKVDLQAWSKSSSEIGLKLVLVSTGIDEQVRVFQREHKIDSPIVRDPRGEITKKLNAFWTGRPYLFGRNGKLAWISMTPLDAQFPANDATFRQAMEKLR